MECVWRLAVGVLSRELVPDGCHLISGGGQIREENVLNSLRVSEVLLILFWW